MLNDPIVDEIHQFRAQLLDQHGGDIAVYFAALQNKQRAQPGRYVSFVQLENTALQGLAKPQISPSASDK
jgi:hypothetical protein